MTNIRRHFKQGQTYFLTHVTHQRNPILIEHVDLLWNALEKTGLNKSYHLHAWAILPDHFHMLIDPLELDVPNLMRRIKLIFSAGYRTKHSLKSGRLWQNRYWDHIIRDELDMNRHIDYIHYNPVKHGLTNNPFSYKHTSIHEYAKRGVYKKDWGCQSNPTHDGEYGE